MDNPTCQHRNINNDTWQCGACDERMFVQRQNVETVQTAPNAAACINPACEAELAAGTYDETRPPTGCTNPSGIYVPDDARARTDVIAFDYEYECGRCNTNAHSLTMDSRGMTWPCGGWHTGPRVWADDRAAS
ncbi:DUF7459 domain-containing protein [Mycolicibacterium sphagni]|uniref:DUF7459 domain-containing protein n=1 Tax=Mycolicibacterium sphagni TaxID=1786 RepID=UPI0021F2BD7A|nr:hypothetical protein [Mycolicibacterium sphagni]MCV7174954.1 hypothetical protein [Mycolicibacterium sphagni]